MKKQRFLICLALLTALCLLTGCSTISVLTATPTPAPTATPEPTAEPTATPEPTPEATPEPAALLEELKFHLDLLNKCYAETCGAVLDLDTSYSRVYTSSQAMIDGEAPIDVVLRHTSNRRTLTDPTDATLYEITNFKTNAEALEYLKQYMTPEIAETLFPNEFLEFDGKLYMVYGSRGYGEYQLDLDSAEISEITDTACTVTLDSLWFETSGGLCTVTFEKQDGRWIITSIYDPAY
ncbi:MAG: IseA DL-endopeptidase inhibitor family protein [Ruminococcus bromii]|nr:IseA DL-endopeptidase inhibitor family protein [Ruminococcus bromii]